MGEVYDCIVILSHAYGTGRSISAEGEWRVDRGIDLYRKGGGECLCMSGATVLGDPRPHPIAQYMKEYAMSKDVPEQAILLETQSKDTIGQAIFTKLGIAVPRNWDTLTIVSSDYHIPRVKKIFEFIYGSDFKLDFIFNETSPEIGKLQFLEEQKSLVLFERTFSGIEPGDDEQILRRLYEQHDLYRKS